MISIRCDYSPSMPRDFTVQLSTRLENRVPLNKVLAQRLANELKDHFRAKNAVPNKRGWKKTNFWAHLGRATGVAEVTETGATVTVADARYAIHVYGGTIKPTGGRKFLTIPLVPDAAGLSVKDYERNRGRELFRLPGTRVLVEKRTRGGDRSAFGAATGSRFRDGARSTVEVADRQQLRAVYALAPQVRIPMDPTAYPDATTIRAALIDEAAKFMARLEFKKGGPA